jgi:hypothetical protein
LKKEKIMPESGMVDRWLTGFIGMAIMVFGLLLLIPTGCLVLMGPPDDESYNIVLFAGLFFTMLGSYLRYYSRQSVSVSNQPGHQSTQNVSVANFESNNANQEETAAIDFDGEKAITNSAYKIYLVKKYSIEKNEVLGQFILGDELFDTIDEALSAAAMKDSEG